MKTALSAAFLHVYCVWRDAVKMRSAMKRCVP